MSSSPGGSVSPKPQAVHIVGIGNMGGAMAINLLARGWSVEVTDIDAQKVTDLKRFGAVAHINRARAAIDLVATIICVVDAAQIRAVLFGDDGTAGLATQLPPGSVVMLCPTVAPTDVEALAARLAESSIHAIDAPMSGGPVRARDGTMTLMVACEAALHQQLLPLLCALASQVFHISERAGDSARTKLVNNLLAGINLVGAAEALALARRLGLDAGKTLAVIEQSSGQSWIGSERMHRALAGDTAPRAHMTLLEKDTRLAIDCAHQAGFEGPLGAIASSVFAAASASGLADQDDAALLDFLSSAPLL
jgi:L-threonate 2-dehydrogenase